MSDMLRMRGITKVYPAVVANKNIDLSVRYGEVHSLLGENGAGKSTLMGILSGVVRPTSGSLELEGKPVRFDSARDAIKHGIGMVYQHFMLIPRLTVAENIMLGMRRKREPLLDIGRAARDIREFAAKYNMEIDPNAVVENLTVGEQQRVEIIKALYRGARLLILDEPTAVLTPQEIRDLFRMIRSFVDAGHAVIFISHKMDEVLEISDRISILRKGEMVHTLDCTEDLSKERLAGLMVGRSVSLSPDRKKASPGAELLRLENVSVLKNKHVYALEDVSFSIRSGEILGVAGVDGNGQSELLELVTGLRRAKTGTVSLKGETINHASPRRLLEMGLAHIPEDRRVRGLVLELDIKENFMINDYYRNPHSNGSRLNWPFIREHASEYVERFSVKAASVDDAVSSLSGGNQQKLVLAREFHGDPIFIAAMHATRGLDIGAIEYVHSQIMAQRDKGSAVLYISTELDELMKISDRLLVLCRGKITGIVDPSETTIEEVGLMMAGRSKEEVR